MGRYTLSIRKILGLEPRNAPAPSANRELAREFFDRGIAAENAGAIEEAQRHYRDAIGADSQFSQAHLCLGIVLQGLGQPAAAIDAHSRAIAFRVSMVALAMCGAITQFGNLYNSCSGGSGSGSVTSNPAAKIVPFRSASASAG